MCKLATNMIPFTLDEQLEHGSLPVLWLLHQPLKRSTTRTRVSNPLFLLLILKATDFGCWKWAESDRIPTTGRPAEAERGNRVVGSCLPCAQKRRASTGSRTASDHRSTSRSGARLLAGRKWEMPPGGFHSVEAGPLPTPDRPAEAERGRAVAGSKVNFTRILVKLVDVGWGRPASDHRLTNRSGARLLAGRKWGMPPGGFHSVEAGPLPTATRPAEAERGRAVVGSKVKLGGPL